MDFVEQRYWMTVNDRYAVGRVDLDSFAKEHRIESAVRDKRSIILRGKYFRVEKAKAALKTALSEAN